MKLRNRLNLLKAGLLAPGLMLLTMTPASLAQMRPGAQMGGSANSNMSNNQNGNMGQQGMQPSGPMGPQSSDQMVEQNMFGNLRRNFDVETKLSKMALKNSSNEDVKKFAQQVIGENHSLSNDLIVPNPTGEMMEPEMVPSQTKKAEKQMKKMTGKPFDQLYLVQMNAYIKNDQEVADKAETMTNVSRVSEVGTRVKSLTDDRQKQIATLTQETGFKIQ